MEIHPHTRLPAVEKRMLSFCRSCTRLCRAQPLPARLSSGTERSLPLTVSTPRFVVALKKRGCELHHLPYALVSLSRWPFLSSVHTSPLMENKGCAGLRSKKPDRYGGIAITRCRNSIMGCENSITRCRNSITRRRNSITGCENSIARCRNSITHCRHAITRRRHAITRCRNSITRRRNSITGCEYSITRCRNSITRRRSSSTRWQNSITPRPNAITRSLNSITRRRNSTTRCRCVIPERAQDSSGLRKGKSRRKPQHLCGRGPSIVGGWRSQ